MFVTIQFLKQRIQETKNLTNEEITHFNCKCCISHHAFPKGESR